jgi:hypothetical protein
MQGDDAAASVELDRRPRLVAAVVEKRRSPWETMWVKWPSDPGEKSCRVLMPPFPSSSTVVPDRSPLL